jgi:hypothetical protein
MAFDLTLHVTLDGEAPYTVDITAGTIIAAERWFKKPAPELFGSVSIEAMAWLAWEQTRKNGITVVEFDRWIDKLVDIETETAAGPLAGTVPQ